MHRWNWYYILDRTALLKSVFKERSLTKHRFSLLPGEQANPAQATGIALGV